MHRPLSVFSRAAMASSPENRLRDWFLPLPPGWNAFPGSRERPAEKKRNTISVSLRVAENEMPTPPGEALGEAGARKEWPSPRTV